jgi:hypothetical protein
VTRNVMTGLNYGVYAYSYYGSQRLRISGNTIVRDTLNSGTSIYVSTMSDSVMTISDNTIQRGLGTGIELNGNNTGIGNARVDSNQVQGMRGTGMSFTGVITAVSMKYNTLADNFIGLSSAVPVQGIFNTVTRNVSAGVFIYASVPTVFRRGNFVGNGHLALANGNLGPPPVAADSSFWGRTTGPRCQAGCDTLVAGGDSVGYPGVAFPPPVPALVAGAPPIPAPLAPAPAFRNAPPVGVLPARAVTRSVERPMPVDRPRPTGVRP